jgi:hypothetical protein
VDIEHQVRVVALRGDLDAAKAFLKQASSPTVGLVDGLGIGVKEIGEMLGGPERNLTGLRDL